MNAPETLKPTTDPINLAHEVLLKADEALCVDEVARAIFCVDKPKKADLRDAGRMLKELADLGMIEMEPPACAPSRSSLVHRLMPALHKCARRRRKQVSPGPSAGHRKDQDERSRHAPPDAARNHRCGNRRAAA